MNGSLIAGFLVIAGVATEASGTCFPARYFTLAYGTSGDYAILFPAGADMAIGGPALKGRFWQSGNRAVANESGSCPEATYMLQVAPGALTIFGGSGADILGTGPCLNQGCVSGPQVMLIQTLNTSGTKAYYAVGKVTEFINDFDYARGGTDWQMVEVPRPRVTATSSQGNNVAVNLFLDPPYGAHGEADGFARSSILTGYQIVYFEGIADPGRAAQAWTNLGSLVPVNEFDASTGPLLFNCGAPLNSAFIALRPVFDGGQYWGDYVSASTRIECDQRVADPRFRMIDAPATRRGTIRSNR